MIRMHWIPLFCLCTFIGSLVWLDSSTSMAQTETPRQKTYEELKVDFDLLERQLIDKENEFNVTQDVLKKDEIKRQYVDLLANVEDVISQLRSTILDLAKSGEMTAEQTKTILGIMVHDANQGRDRRVLEAGDDLIQAKINPEYFKKAAGVERLSIGGQEIFEELQTRQQEFQADDLPRVKIATTKGDIVVELFENEAPNTVANFISLVEKDFYDDVVFHRVIDGFVAQTGDPKGNGTGGPGYTIACECYTPEARAHFTGTVSMAHSGRDTGGSQFFITMSRTENLDGRHTVFGRVLSGLDVLSQLTRTHTTGDQPIEGVVPDKMLNIEILRKRDHEYVPVTIEEQVPEGQPPNPPPANHESGKSGGGDGN